MRNGQVLALVVQDDDFLSQIESNKLEEQGVCCVVVNAVWRACAFITTYGYELDIIFWDVELQDGTSAEAITDTKENPSFKGLQVGTGEGEEHAKFQRWRGCDDWINPTFPKAELDRILAMIRK